MLTRTTPLLPSLPASKTCTECPKVFATVRPMQSVCSPRCAARKVVAAKKAERSQTKARREAIMTHGDWLAAAQVEFNRYIRLRDRGRPCICCGKPMEPDRPGGSVDAGHYRSRGSSPHLRFDERNCHAQRKSCNRPGGTTAASFRAGMVQRIGLAALERLEADQEPRKYTVADLKALRALYRAKCRELAAQSEPLRMSLEQREAAMEAFIAQARKEAETLARRLEPALAPQMPKGSDAGNAPKPVQAPILDQLCGAKMRVQELAMLLSSLNARLAL